MDYLGLEISLNLVKKRQDEETQIYEKLYIIDDTETMSKNLEDSFLLCGVCNWDWYFTKFDKDTEFEELNNIKFIEFENRDEFNIFLDSNDIIDYSLEF